MFRIGTFQNVTRRKLIISCALIPKYEQYILIYFSSFIKCCIGYYLKENQCLGKYHYFQIFNNPIIKSSCIVYNFKEN